MGECRGAEALDMLQAMNTGHDGSLSTGHANSCKDMLSRLETMVLMGVELPLQAIRSQIASGIDILIHLGRLRDKTRKVLTIAEITGLLEGEIQWQELFRFEEVPGESDCVQGGLVRVGTLRAREKCCRAGFDLAEGERDGL